MCQLIWRYGIRTKHCSDHAREARHGVIHALWVIDCEEVVYVSQGWNPEYNPGDMTEHCPGAIPSMYCADTAELHG
jgi:hypothetical protein